MSLGARTKTWEEQEIWETQTVFKSPMSGAEEKVWGYKAPARPEFADRLGVTSYGHPRNCPVPQDRVVIQEFHVDSDGLSNGRCDKDGWSYHSTLAGLDADLARGTEKGEDGPKHVYRRRRWVRRLQLEEEEDSPVAGETMSGKALEGWLGIRSDSNGKMGRVNWKSRYFVLLEPSSSAEQGEDEENINVAGNNDGLVDRIKVSHTASETSLLDGAKNPRQKRNKLLMNSSKITATYKKQKEKISHIGKSRFQTIEGNVKSDPVLVYFRKEVNHSNKPVTREGVVDNVSAVGQATNKGTKNQNMRWFVLGPECIIDDTIATANDPGHFAIHFSKKIVQVLNAQTEHARLRWIEALRQVLDRAHPKRSPTAVVRKRPTSKPTMRLLNARMGLNGGSVSSLPITKVLLEDEGTTEEAPPSPPQSFVQGKKRSSSLLLASKSYASNSCGSLDINPSPRLGGKGHSPFGRSFSDSRRGKLTKSKSQDNIMMEISVDHHHHHHQQQHQQQGHKKETLGLSIRRKLKSTFRHTRHPSLTGLTSPSLGLRRRSASPQKLAPRKHHSTTLEAKVEEDDTVATEKEEEDDLASFFTAASQSSTLPVVTLDSQERTSMTRRKLSIIVPNSNLSGFYSEESLSVSSAASDCDDKSFDGNRESQIACFTIKKSENGLGFCIQEKERGKVMITKVFEDERAPCIVASNVSISLQAGDRIIKVAGRTVETSKDILDAMENVGVGSFTDVVVEPNEISRKLGDIYALFREEIPCMFASPNDHGSKTVVTYMSIQQRIMDILGVSSSLGNTAIFKCWFRDHLDQFFEANRSTYEISGIDMESMTPVVAQAKEI